MVVRAAECGQRTARSLSGALLHDRPEEIEFWLWGVERDAGELVHDHARCLPIAQTRARSSAPKQLQRARERGDEHTLRGVLGRMLCRVA